jgi:transcriptional regulator with XRE-family HTH domain
MPLNAESATPNLVLYNIRDATGASQQDTANALNRLAAAKGNVGSVTANQYSRWERGITRPSPFYRQLLCEHFGVSVEELGLTRPRSTQRQEETSSEPTAHVAVAEEAAVHPAVASSQTDWRSIRRTLNGRRATLAHAVSGLYEAGRTVPGTALLAHPDWLPAQPIPLDRVQLEHDDRDLVPLITGTAEYTSHVRPLIGLDRRFHRYSQAVRSLDHPKLFENRMAWRLLDLSWSGDAGYMGFGDTTYFEQVDVSEALAHESAVNLVEPDGRVGPAKWKGLTLRREIGDPFDLTRRALGTSTDTLTIRRDRDGATFVLHDRSSGSVAVAGGMLHVMPCGIFQPSSIRPAAMKADFDLWRNIMREYSEEFLGNAEHDGDGAPIDYTAAPFGDLEEARRAGKVRAYCLGVGLDALTLFGEVLTVVVFDADFYDTFFSAMVDVNDEGTIVKTGKVHPTSAIPFTEHMVRELVDSGRLAPAAAGCLRLAWDHRRAILDD